MAHAPEDPYAVLGVPPTASQDEISRAYRRLVREHHPDLHPSDPAKPAEPQSSASTRPLRRVLDAYALLRDPASRAEYDRAAGVRRPRTEPPSGPYFQDQQAYIRDVRPDESVWVGPVRFHAGPTRHDRPEEQAIFDDLLALILRHFRLR
jgi:curved DNA-binding protein CbpA